jgi:hypothetical protein
MSDKQWTDDMGEISGFGGGYEALHSHTFGDGTYMSISVRDAKPRERIERKNGYGSLLRDLAMQKWSELKGTDGG